MKKFQLALGLMVALMAGATAPALAQSTTSGDISGTLSDPTGAVVPNATITVTNTGTGETKTVTSSAGGSFRASLLTPGSYKVTATAPGFSTVTGVVTVSAGVVSEDDIKLPVGASGTTVEVNEVPEFVNTTNADITTTLSAQEVQRMPNPGNDLTFVAQTAPGTVMNTGTAAGGYGNFSSFGISGLSNMFSLDGGYENDPFLNLNNTGASNLTLGNNEVDTVTVVAPAYSAQYGGLGGAQVSEITAAGTNRLHGNLSYYWDGRALNSNDWFNKQSEAFNGTKNQPTFVNANQWAARIGGPALKDRLFWFVDTEGIRATTPASGQIYVPTAQTAACAEGSTTACAALNAAADANCAASPNTSTCVGNNGYAAFAPASASQLPLVTTIMNTFRNSPFRPGASSVHADPNDAALETYYTSSQSNLKEWLLTARADWKISDKDTFFVHYKQDHGVQPTYVDLIDPRFDAYSPQPAYEGQMSEAHSFTPNLTNQLVVTGNWYSAPFQNTNNYLPIAPFTFVPNLDGDLYEQYYGGDDYAFPQGRRVTGYQVIDDVSWTRGRHTVRFGYNIRRDNVTDLDQSRSVAPLAEGSEEAFFAGQIDYVWSQYFPVKPEQPVSVYDEGIYVQDEYKVLPNLTLTAGIRLERNSNPVCHTLCFESLSTDVNSLATSSSTIASANVPYSAAYPGGYIKSSRYRAFTKYQKLAVMPRLGLNWQPEHNTVIRAGFGMFSDSFPALIADTIMGNAPDNFHAAAYGPVGGGAADLNLDPSTAGSGGAYARASNAAFQNGYASGGTYTTIRSAVAAAGGLYSAPSFTTTTPAGIKYPTYEEWSLAVERRLDAKSSLTLTYAGNHGYHEPVENGGRNLTLASASATKYPTLFATNGTAKPVTAFGTLTNVYSGASSNFNGVVVTAQRHQGNLTAVFNYQWSHALDEVSNGGLEPFAPDNGDAESVANPYNLHAQYGNADYDVRQNITGNVTWSVPNYLHKWDEVFGGFEFNAVAFHQTGLPYTITYSSSTAGFSNGTVNLFAKQANNNFDHHCGGGNHALLPDGSIPNPCSFRSNASFVAPTDFTQQHRNSLTGPAYSNVDFGAFKNFKIPHYEFMKIKVGAQFFNLFNHPNFQNPGHALTGSSTYGAITSTVGAPTSILGSVGGADASPRLIQLHGEFTF
ncbi:TonB-dependent Receptor Plug Domain [Bryocella elongata]|uniref:TonB-dependent Receptor Plug Domain n=1 Tax=Bryocella elongata TaxID=863522 RepID=A0A1H5Y0X6_9BACT|nr:TonB-dependent receptor [Bryocella elongata]SEG17317.1 TonB-dependent Receptor Plug Domain [Bryocella elongata]